MKCHIAVSLPVLRRTLVDGIVRFNPLTQELMLKVVDKFLSTLEVKLRRKKIRFKVSTKAKKWLAKRGFDPAMGARPLARLIDNKIKHQLTDLFKRITHFAARDLVRLAYYKDKYWDNGVE